MIIEQIIIIRWRGRNLFADILISALERFDVFEPAVFQDFEAFAAGKTLVRDNRYDIAVSIETALLQDVRIRTDIRGASDVLLIVSREPGVSSTYCNNIGSPLW